MVITYRRPQLNLVLDLLMPVYRRREGPYAGLWPPLLPPFRSERMKALFWFHVPYFMRGPNREEGAINGIVRLFRARPDLFRPEVAQRYAAQQITQILRAHNLNFKAEEIGRGWVINTKRLHQLWADDPRELFSDQPSYETLCDRIQNRGGHGFFGFQEKNTSLLIHYFIEQGLLAPFLYPGPVERHVLRIMFAHEVIVPSTYAEPVYNKDVLPDIRGMLVDYCRQRQVDPVDLHNALWILSRRWCERHPGNTLLIDGPKDGRRTKYFQPPYQWNAAERASYHRTCGQCPIERSCRRCISDAPYYVSGDIDASRIRDKPPDAPV